MFQRTAREVARLQLIIREPCEMDHPRLDIDDGKLGTAGAQHDDIADLEGRPGHGAHHDAGPPSAGLSEWSCCMIGNPRLIASISNDRVLESNFSQSEISGPCRFF